MTEENEKTTVLLENYDGMTGEGKNELLRIGENFLKWINPLREGKPPGQHDELPFNDEKRT
jgi:hypothetical protein